MARQRKPCKGHTQYFPQEPRQRYVFEFNKVPDVCKRCQKAAIEEGQNTGTWKETKTQVAFYIDKEAKARVDGYASENDRSISSVLREAVDFYLLKYD